MPRRRPGVRGLVLTIARLRHLPSSLPANRHAVPCHAGTLGSMTARLVPEEPPPLQIDGSELRGHELRSAAGAVADRVAGATAAAIDATPTATTVVAVLGCLLAGVPAVPVAPDAGPGERAHLLHDCGAQLWLGPDRPGVDIASVPVDSAARSTTTWAEPEAGTALILYTSGTTGRPKGVVLSRSAIAADLDGLRDAWAWTPADTLVHGLPLFHVHGLVLGVLGALRAGSPLVHTGRPTPAAYAAAAGSLYFGVPTVWGRIAADEQCARGIAHAPGCSSQAARHCRPRCTRHWAHSPGRRRSSGTA